jgi:hypothetical protein
MKGLGLQELWAEVAFLCAFLLLIVFGVSRTIKKHN